MMSALVTDSMREGGDLDGSKNVAEGSKIIKQMVSVFKLPQDFSF